MATKQITDVRDTINVWLAEQDRTIHWLAKKADINYSTLYSILFQKIIKMSEEKLDKINDVLGTDFKA